MTRNVYQHSEAGVVYVDRFSADFPEGRPFFCCGRFYASPDEAFAGFTAEWERSKSEPDVVDTNYARMEARMISPGVFEED